MPPSPRSLLCPTMLMPRKWCLSAGAKREQVPAEGAQPTRAPHTPLRGAPTEASPMLSVTVMMFRDMVESVMLLKEEACGGMRVRKCRGGCRRADPTQRRAATYTVCLPQALLPPPALVLPDKPGGGALLRGATQSGGGWGADMKVRGQVTGCRAEAGGENRVPPNTHRTGSGGHRR